MTESDHITCNLLTLIPNLGVFVKVLECLKMVLHELCVESNRVAFPCCTL